MGCNTSKEVMQGPVENSGSVKISGDDRRVEIIDEIKTIVDDTIVQMEVPVASSTILQPEITVGQYQDNILNARVEKAKLAVGNLAKLEVKDIDPSDPEANRAATKIQAAFRGHQTRKNMKQGDAEPKQNLEKEFNSEDKELCEAATKIQASFRGHLVRKTAPRKDEEEELSRELKKLDAKAPEEELDIDLTDPDLQVAATKIQASFRGHRVRKEKQSGSNE